MAPPAAGGSLAVALARRNELGGATGYRALVQNAHVFGLAVFCSLGGLIYGYNQGVFSGILAMPNFTRQIPEAVPAGTKGWLTSILELGAWLGTICTGPIAESIGRKRGVQFAVLIFCIGVIVQVTAYHAGSIYAGRFITGWGVGSISMLVPMYNAEISPPEIRGALVGLQQLSITFGILISFWLDYGTNYIGGTGATQAAAAWRLPLALQLVPGLILGIGFIWMPYSPRFLMMKGREDEALVVLAALRRLPSDHRLVQLEFLEIKAQVVFDRETDLVNFPNVVPGSLRASFEGYKSLFTNRAYFRRVMVACLTMFFQQWTGINAILYYAPSIFEALGLTGNTISLLATGVVGIVMWLATIPAVLYIDKVGRKPVLVSGAILMAICHFIVAGLSGKYEDDWPAHKAAGWVCVVAIWFFVAFFGYSWGPAAWIIVAEVFPSSIRSKGMSVGASSNWANNFAVGLATPSMLQHLRFGTYIFFGTLTAMGAAWVQFMVPETKGVTLEEMDVAFGDVAGTSHADLSRKAKIDREIGLEALLLNGETSPSVHSAEKHNEVEKREFTHHA